MNTSHYRENINILLKTSRKKALKELSRNFIQTFTNVNAETDVTEISRLRRKVEKKVHIVIKTKEKGKGGWGGGVNK